MNVSSLLYGLLVDLSKRFSFSCFQPFSFMSIVLLSLLLLFFRPFNSYETISLLFSALCCWHVQFSGFVFTIIPTKSISVNNPCDMGIAQLEAKGKNWIARNYDMENATMFLPLAQHVGVLNEFSMFFQQTKSTASIKIFHIFFCRDESNTIIIKIF